jgi:spore germination protein KA
MRLILLILAATTGGYGITIGLLGALVHLASLESFGVPYLSPVVPFVLTDSKDALIRAPLWIMLSRPKGMSQNDKKRKNYFVPPAGNSNDGDKK